MRYLVFDTETDGKIKRNNGKQLSDLEKYPHIVELGWFLCSDTGQVLAEGGGLIQPQGFTIPEDAKTIHGITTEHAKACGVTLKDALETFLLLIQKDTTTLVAHNMAFDGPVIGLEIKRLGLEFGDFLTAKRLCTMRTTKALINKWPKLGELYTILFGTTLTDAHRAKPDAEACMRCFFELKARGWYKPLGIE